MLSFHVLGVSRRPPQDALLPERRDNGSALPELECEYCFKRERELCSPMVVDLSPEEAEAFLKQQEAVRESAGVVARIQSLDPPPPLPI